ncbi:hypothetical protein SAI_2055 [Streptococcus agalactiae H36B]|nr:hypothetical protein SAI_2055 [Streptococcus agalactiae H36B]
MIYLKVSINYIEGVNDEEKVLDFTNITINSFGEEVAIWVFNNILGKEK